MIRIELNQSILSGAQKLPRLRLAGIERELTRALKRKRDYLVSAAFVSSSQMRKLNRVYRGKAGVTDVLAFPFENGEYAGEVLICYEQAKKQAKDMKHSVRDEITFLLVHGVLHVFGFDHEVPSGAVKMFAKQSDILESLGVNPRI